jgi:hypothetical protein
MWKIDRWGFDQSITSDSHMKNWQLEIWSKQNKWFSCEYLTVEDLIKSYQVILMIRITYITLIISPAVNFSHENYLLCQIPQLSILHMRITHHALIKSLTINFSHENHLSCFDQIHSCPFFTWESLGMIWSNPQLSNIHMRITCFALIKSPAVNFSHENHLLCFDQILICQFFTWESLVMLWSNPHLSIYITLIKSPSVNLYYWFSCEKFTAGDIIKVI